MSESPPGPWVTAAGLPTCSTLDHGESLNIFWMSLLSHCWYGFDFQGSPAAQSKDAATSIAAALKIALRTMFAPFFNRSSGCRTTNAANALPTRELYYHVFT
jgi:hypothetical protein